VALVAVVAALGSHQTNALRYLALAVALVILWAAMPLLGVKW
jgi:hypothetical protein